jgi:hypothetical protein
MFTNQHHLKHLLRPYHYTARSTTGPSCGTCSSPSWHPVAVKSDLAKARRLRHPRPARNALHHPQLRRRVAGLSERLPAPAQPPHLTSPRGNSEKLRCQYHGWEFKADGGTAKIPDAKVFRPWDRENSCLRRFRVDTCGDLVFVNFTRQGPTLREWLDPVWDAWGSTAGVPARGDVGEGLPVQLEGGAGELLESYHIPEVHPYTFKEFPAEENAWHELTTDDVVPDGAAAGVRHPRRRTGWCGGWACR